MLAAAIVYTFCPEQRFIKNEIFFLFTVLSFIGLAWHYGEKKNFVKKNRSWSKWRHSA